MKIPHVELAHSKNTQEGEEEKAKTLPGGNHSLCELPQRTYLRIASILLTNLRAQSHQ